MDLQTESAAISVLHAESNTTERMTASLGLTTAERTAATIQLSQFFQSGESHARGMTTKLLHAKSSATTKKTSSLWLTAAQS